MRSNSSKSSINSNATPSNKLKTNYKVLTKNYVEISANFPSKKYSLCSQVKRKKVSMKIWLFRLVFVVSETDILLHFLIVELKARFHKAKCTMMIVYSGHKYSIQIKQSMLLSSN